MIPRPPRARVLPAVVMACAAALSSPLTGCGESAPPPPAAAPTKPPPEQATYPILHLFVEARDKPRSPTKPPRTREAAQALAEATVTRLRAPGADFAAIAREVSDDAVTAAAEGFGGFCSYWAGDDPVIVEAASKLAVGAVSDPLPAATGFNVIKRLSREEGKALEARVVVPMEGFLYHWAELDPAREPRRSKAEAYAEAADAVMKLRAGADVERMMLEVQNVKTFALPMRRRGIDGWDAFIDASFAATVGAWIGPIETRDGWAVARRQPYVRAGVRHLVVTHRESPGPSKRDRTPEQADEIARRALARLEADPSSWAQVVAETSDEPGSRAVGGYLGDFTTAAEARRRMAPEIQRELMQMAPGARGTEVVATRFGFHIFWRLD